MAAILEIGDHIEILRRPRFFLKGDPYRVFVPILLLVS